MTSLQAAKKALRAELRQKLKELSLEEKFRQSSAVAEKLFQNERFRQSSRVSIYLSRDIEVSTESILKKIFESGKTCFIPKYDSTKPHMEMVRLKSLKDYENLPLTSWNIKQPLNCDSSREEAISSGGLDLMIVPGIGFSKEGHRIGNGKGYYDVYIKRYNDLLEKPVHTVALAFTDQIVPHIPCSDHDVVLNEVICPD